MFSLSLTATALKVYKHSFRRYQTWEKQINLGAPVSKLRRPLVRGEITTTSSQEPLELLTAKQVRKILQCSLSMVYKLADKGLIGSVPMPTALESGGRGMVRFTLDDVLAFIGKHHRRAINDT